MLCSLRYLSQSFVILPPRSPSQADEHNFRNALHCTPPTTPPQARSAFLHTHTCQHCPSCAGEELTHSQTRLGEEEAAHPQRVVLAARDQPSCCSLQCCDGLLVGAGHGVGELAHDDIAAAEQWGGWDAASARGSCSEKAQ